MSTLNGPLVRQMLTITQMELKVVSNSPSDIATTCLGEEKLQSEVSDMFSGYFASCCLSEV